MSVSLVQRVSSYNFSGPLTGKETEQDAVRMEFQAASLEANGEHMECLQLMEKALQVRCRIFSSDAVSSMYIGDLCDAAERLITKSNAYGVKCFKADEYDTASRILAYALEMTGEGSFPLSEADDRRRYLRGVTLNNFGCMERRRGHFSDALSYLQRSMECTGEQSPVAFLNMSAVQTQLRLCEDAAGSAMRAMQNLGSTPEDSLLLAVAHHNLAMALELLDPPRAFEEYHSALALAQATIGKNSETTTLIERNLARFLQVSKSDKVGVSKTATSVHPFPGSFHWGWNSQNPSGSKSPKGLSSPKKPDDEDIFPHPFVMSAADEGVLPKITRTRMYHPPATIRRTLEPLVPKRARPLKESVSNHKPSQFGKDRDVSAQGAPLRQPGTLKEHSVPKVSRLPPVASSSQQQTHTTVASTAFRRPSLGPQNSLSKAKPLGGVAANRDTATALGKKLPISSPSGTSTTVKRFSGSAPNGRSSTPQHSSSVATTPSKVSRMPLRVNAVTHPSKASSTGFVTDHTVPFVNKPVPGSLRQDATAANRSGHTRLHQKNIPFAEEKKLSTLATPQPRKPSVSATTQVRSTSPTTPQPRKLSLAATTQVRSTSPTTSQPRKPSVSATTQVRSTSPTTARPKKPSVAATTQVRSTSPTTSQPRKPSVAATTQVRSTSPTTARPKKPSVSGSAQPMKLSGSSTARTSFAARSSVSRLDAGLDSKQVAPGYTAANFFSDSEATRWKRRSVRMVPQGSNLDSYISDRLDMLLVDEEELERKHGSASVIQRTFRMYKARRLLRELRESRECDHALREIRESITARRLQRWFRRHFYVRWGTSQRMKGREIISGKLHKAAILVQRIARGWLGRRRYKRRKFYDENSERAVIAIQLWWRQIQAKRKLERLKRWHEDSKAIAAERERRELAATVIQSNWRARRAKRATRAERLRAKELRQKIWKARCQSAAYKIQTWWRLLMARAELQRLREVQVLREARLREHLRRTEAATKLQAFGRMIIVRKDAKTLLTSALANAAHIIRGKRLENQASSKIQRAFRFYHSKLLLERLQTEHQERLFQARQGVFVLVVQRIGRGFCIRRELGTVLCDMKIKASEFSRKERTLEVADRLREAALFNRQQMTPVVVLEESVATTVCKPSHGAPDASDTPPLVCDVVSSDVHGARNAPNTLETMLSEMEGSHRKEETPETQYPTAVFVSIPMLVAEERELVVDETKQASQHVKEPSQSVETREGYHVGMDEGQRAGLRETTPFLEEERLRRVHALEQHLFQGEVKQPGTRSTTVPVVEGNEALETLPVVNEAEELQAIREEARRLRTLSISINLLEEGLEGPHLMEETIEEQKFFSENQQPQKFQHVTEVPVYEPCIMSDALTHCALTPSLPEKDEGIKAAESSSLEAALAVEREVRRRAMAEEKRLREERGAIREKSNNYRLQKIAAANSAEELHLLIPHPPLARCRRDLRTPTLARFTSSSGSLYEQKQEDTLYLARKREKSALIISRMLRGYLDRQYVRTLREIAMKYVEYRVDMDREESPLLDHELLYQLSEEYQTEVGQARGERQITAVQAFLRALGSARVIGFYVDCVEHPQKASFLPPKFQPKSEYLVKLYGFVRIIQAKRERAIRKRAVNDWLEEIRRLEAVAKLGNFARFLQAKKERLARSHAVRVYLQCEEKQKRLVWRRTVDVILGFLYALEAQNRLSCCKAAVGEENQREKAAKRIASFFRICLAKNKLLRRKMLAQRRRSLDINLETVLDNAAMRVQRAYRSHNARRRAKEQRDAKKKYWNTLQAQDEELTAAMAAIVADAADHANLWASLGYYVNEEELDGGFKEMVHYVVVVQQIARGWFAWRHVQRLRLQRSQGREE